MRCTKLYSYNRFENIVEKDSIFCSIFFFPLGNRLESYTSCPAFLRGDIKFFWRVNSICSIQVGIGILAIEREKKSRRDDAKGFSKCEMADRKRLGDCFCV